MIATEIFLNENVNTATIDPEWIELGNVEFLVNDRRNGKDFSSKLLLNFIQIKAILIGD